MADNNAIINPTLGLVYNQGPLGIPAGGLLDGRNFRVQEGFLHNLNLGWERFGTDIQLNGPVLAIDRFFPRGGSEQLIFATPTDLYKYDSGTDGVLYITPIYSVDTASASGTAVTGHGTPAEVTFTYGEDTTPFGVSDTCTFKINIDGGGAVTATVDYGVVIGVGIGAAIDDIDECTQALSDAIDNEGTYSSGVDFNVTNDGTYITIATVSATHESTLVISNVTPDADGGSNANTLWGLANDSGTGTGPRWDLNAKSGDFISFGADDENDPDATWYEILTVSGPRDITLTSSAGTVADGDYTIRKTLTASATSQFKSAKFANAAPDSEDEWWATNGSDYPIKWNGTDTTVELMSGLNFTCEHLEVYSNMMIFGDVTYGGERYNTRIETSNIGNPSEAGDDGTGYATTLQAHAGLDGITALERYGDYLMIYSEERVTVAQFVDDADIVLAFRDVISGIGAVGKNAVADFGDYHEFVGTDSLYRFDGASISEIGTHVFRNILRTQDPSRISRAYHHFDDENGDLLWVIPQSTDSGAGTVSSSPEMAFVQHYLENIPDSDENPYSRRDFPFSATGYFERQTGITWAELTDTWADYNFRWDDRFFFAAFPLNLAGDEDGYIYTFNTSQNKSDGTGLESYVHFGRRATVDGHMRGLITRVVPFVRPYDTPITLTVLLSDHPTGAATRQEVVSFDQSHPEIYYFATVYRRGRFFELKFGTAGPNQPWELEGYDYLIRQGGRV